MTGPQLVGPDNKPVSTHDANGVKVTMPFIVSITTQWLVEARTKEQAVAAVQRGTSYSAVIIPAQLGFVAEAGVAPPEILADLVKKGKTE